MLLLLLLRAGRRPPQPLRELMSYGLARGRSLDTTGVGLNLADLPPFEHGRIDPRHWFNHPDHRFELEIGSGKGTFLLQEAASQPESNFLGIEWAGEFHRYAADRIRRRGLPNVKLLHGDAIEFIRFWLADNIAVVVHLYFSDPWPKTRHHKRRVVQDSSMVQFHRILALGGELRLVTDHDDLWAWYEDHAARYAGLFDRREFQPPGSAGQGEVVGSNFERKYRREGRPFHAMTLVKRSALEPRED